MNSKIEIVCKWSIIFLYEYWFIFMIYRHVQSSRKQISQIGYSMTKPKSNNNDEVLCWCRNWPLFYRRDGGITHHLSFETHNYVRVVLGRISQSVWWWLVCSWWGSLVDVVDTSAYKLYLELGQYSWCSMIVQPRKDNMWKAVVN